MRSVFASLGINFFLLLLFIQVEGQSLLAKFQDQEGKLVLNETHFKQEGLCQKPLLYTIVSGLQGYGKSSLLKALGRLFNVPNSAFKSGSSYKYCTGSIDASDANDWGLVLLDLMGTNDAKFAKDVNLNADTVYVMSTSLVVPFANIVIYSVKGTIRETDKNWIPVFSELMEAGRIPIHKDAPKPLLILTLRSEPRDGGKTAEDIFEEFLPVDQLKSKFSDIKYAFISEIYGEEKKLLQEGNFFPEKVPSYWSSVQEIGRIIQSYANALPTESRWTGCEANEIMIHNLPRINEQQSLDPQSVYIFLMSRRITNAINAVLEPLLNSPEVKEWIEDPLRQSGNVEDFLQLKFKEAKQLVQNQFVGLEKTFKETIQVTLKQGFEDYFTPTIVKVSESISKLQEAAARAKEVAESELEATNNAIVLDGYPAEVNCQIKQGFDVAIRRYDRKMGSIKVSDEMKAKDKDSLIKIMNNFLAYKHIENENIRLQRRNNLYDTIRTHHEYVSEGRKVCANGQDEIPINLAGRLPAFFRPEVLPYLHHVTAELDSTDSCSGALTLTAPGEFQVCKQFATCCSRGQHKISELYYNSSNTNLRLFMKLANWGSGCKNFIDFRGIRLTIHQRVIVDELELAKPYDRNEGLCRL